MSFERTSRRQFIATLGAAGISAALSGSALLGQNQNRNPRRLDLHHHFGSPRWIKRIAEIKRQGWETFQNYSPLQAKPKTGTSRNTRRKHPRTCWRICRAVGIPDRAARLINPLSINPALNVGQVTEQVDVQASLYLRLDYPSHALIHYK